MRIILFLFLTLSACKNNTVGQKSSSNEECLFSVVERNFQSSDLGIFHEKKLVDSISAEFEVFVVISHPKQVLNEELYVFKIDKMKLIETTVYKEGNHATFFNEKPYQLDIDFNQISEGVFYLRCDSFGGEDYSITLFKEKEVVFQLFTNEICTQTGNKDVNLILAFISKKLKICRSIN